MKKDLSDIPPEKESDKAIAGRLTQLIHRWEWGVYHGVFGVANESYLRLMAEIKSTMKKHGGVVYNENKTDFEIDECE